MPSHKWPYGNSAHLRALRLEYDARTKAGAPFAGDFEAFVNANYTYQLKGKDGGNFLIDPISETLYSVLGEGFCPIEKYPGFAGEDPD